MRSAPQTLMHWLPYVGIDVLVSVVEWAINAAAEKRTIPYENTVRLS